MNVAKAIEIALANTLRRFGNLTPDVLVRAWQSLDTDPRWSEDVDRDFPMVDVRCAPYRVDDNQSTLSNDCAILCGTISKDDQTHAAVSKLHDDVQGVIDRLFSQFRLNADGAELTFFKAEMLRLMASANRFTFGGFTIGDPLAPTDQNGISLIGISLVVHYSRADF